MEINTYIFLFSILIFILGFVSFHLTSKEFDKMEDGKFTGGSEEGPRAAFFDALYEAFSEDDDWAKKIRNAKDSEIKDVVREMNKDRKKD